MRIVVRKGAVPIGAVLAACEIAAAILLRLLPFHRVPVPLCTFRAITGMPCMTCGSTRALMRLSAFDPMTAFEIQPLFTVLMMGVLVFGVADLTLYLTRRSALSLHCEKRSIKWLSVVAALLVLANWIYLLLGALRS